MELNELFFDTQLEDTNLQAGHTVSDSAKASPVNSGNAPAANPADSANHCLSHPEDFSSSATEAHPMPESDDNLPDDPEEDGCICGLIEVHSANSWIKQAADDPDPNSLYDTLWYEGELACLFADSNLGKSILAVQIAKEIAQFQRVIYFDFELSRKQFEMRYRDEVTDKPYRFPENFDRAQINIDRYKSGDFEDMIIRSIESVAVHRKANVLIIDNLTWICNASEKGLDAGNLMIRLNTLKKTHGWSMLIVAHTPKRDLTTALTQNDLAGSKRLFNFFDSVFALGKCADDENLRYLKQLKARNCAIEYGAENVLLGEIRNIDGFTQMVFGRCDMEANHLTSKVDVKEKRNQKIRELRSQGYTYRQIAETLGVGVATVNTVLREMNNDNM